MSQSILDSLLGSIPPDLATRAASMLGESPQAVDGGLRAAAPALLAGLLLKTRTPSAQGELLDLLRDPALAGTAPRDGATLGNLLTDGSPLATLGSRFLAWLFGNRSGAVASAIGAQAGLTRGTETSLLSLAAPLVLSVLGDRVRREGLGASGLVRLLAGDRDRIAAAAPAGLASALGIDSLRDLPTPTLPPVAREAASSTPRWLIPLGLALLALLGVWSLVRRERATEPAPAVVERSAPAPPPVAAPPPAQSLFQRTLPTGYSLSAADTGVERRLVGLLEDPNLPLDDTMWFDFDRLTFETGSATLRSDSRVQLRNVAEILQAWPSTRIKIGGYTDDTGDSNANLALSQARAASVRTELITLGVAPDRLEAEGYGSSHPVATNATEEGRAQNRRIALRVVQR